MSKGALAILCAVVCARGAVSSELEDKIAEVSEAIACDVCKDSVADVWDKSVKRQERGDEADAERIEEYIVGLCTTQGLEDEHTVDDNDGDYVFRRKQMRDYEAEGGVVTTVTNPDGTTHETMELKQTVTSEVNTMGGKKRPIDPATWRGIAIQQACRAALITQGSGTRMAELLVQRFWPNADDNSEVDVDVSTHASTEATIKKHVCVDLSKVCAASDLLGPPPNQGGGQEAKSEL